MIMNRRNFASMSALGAAGLLAGCATTTARRRVSPNGKLCHACIGVNGMGGVDLDNFLSHPAVEIVALCDVDRNHLDQAGRKVPGARRYADWRELLAKEGDRIDSINVATPDHMHAAIELPAIRAGKHVFGQKPLAHDVAECRALALAVRRAGVVTQLGTQYASGLAHRIALGYFQAKAIGDVQRIIFTANRPGIDSLRVAGPRPAHVAPAPAELDWDLWLGTAPERPFAPGIYHPGVWRSWQDFGTGWSGDIGCHLFNSAWKGLGLTAPLSVVAEVQESWRDSPARRADTWPQAQHITWTFPGNEMTGGKELPVEWYDGMLFPPEDIKKLEEANGYQGEAMMAIGTEGMLYLPLDGAPRLLPAGKFKDYPHPKPQPLHHYHSFVDACFGGPGPMMPFSVAGPMTEAILLGTVAVRNPGTVLNWNPARMTIPNAPEAGQLLRRQYRAGWEVRGI
jgi:predicted dehydrogenase